MKNAANLETKSPAAQQLAQQGFAVVHPVLSPAECDALADQVTGGASASGGTRSLLQQDWCRALAQRLRTHPALALLLASAPTAVQCTYFEKSAGRNWLVPLHQDLSIPVAGRVDHPALGAWSQKEGALFVQPPAALLQQLVAVRVHIDPCAADDGPLRVIPGSHLGGIATTPTTTTALRQGRTEQVCTVAQGGAMLMRPLLLHASSKSTGSGRRRVLHFLFGPATLPMGLAWADAV